MIDFYFLEKNIIEKEKKKGGGGGNKCLVHKHSCP